MKRYIVALFLLPLLPIRALFFAISWASLGLWRRRRLGPGRYYILDLAGEVVEAKDEGRFQRMIRDLVSPRPDDGVVLDEIRAIRRSLELRAPPGLIVRLGSLEGGYAKCLELRDELRLIAKTTKVYVHLRRGAAGRELVVASAGHHVSAPPTVTIHSTGAASIGFFGVRLLERFGLRANVASRGRYKSAIEPFTRSERSPEDIEQTTALIEGLDETVANALAERGGRSREETSALMDDAPYSGVRAAEAGLIDAALREEELVSKIAADLQPVRLRLGRGGQLSRGEKRPKLALVPSSKAEIGMVFVQGAIVDRRAPHRLTQAAEPEVIDDLRTALEDSDVAAVVLYIDSPGGSATASDAIFGAVQRLDRDKPVVAFFSDVAASGGYYIACGARRIIASPQTITGSIGVFHLLPNFSGLLERLEVKVDTVKLRKNADLASPWRPLLDDEQERLDREVGEVYDRFVDLVAEARKLPKEKVEEVAQGRVWLGRDAQPRGLVDELGGLEAAIEAARRMAARPCEPRPRMIRTKRRTQNRLPSSVTPDPVSTFLDALGPLSRAEARLVRQVLLLRATSDQPTWLYAPLALR